MRVAVLLLALVAGNGLAADAKLAGTGWRLAEFRSMSDEVGSRFPDHPLAVQLHLAEDGTATFRLDCNRGTAKWQAQPSSDASNGGFEFGVIASTRALCPGAGLGERLARDAQYVRGYFLRDGRLSLSLMADGGIYLFDPIPPKAGPEDGGPRVWTVVNAPSGLNLRAAPSTRASVVTHYRNGDWLDNLGCEVTGSRQWCYVQAFGGGPVGFVAADYLAPTLAPDGSMPAGPDDSALRAGRGDFDATGKIMCGRAMCDFGVARSGGGFATVVFRMADGRDRAIYFRMGEPMGANTSEADGYPAFSATKTKDMYNVRVGQERYQIPEAVIFGGKPP